MKSGRISQLISERESVRLMHERYEYWDKVPYPGLFIDGKPALTQVDVEKIGDYMLYLVRDPLGKFGKDAADYVADRLENVEFIGHSGLFKTYTGYYKGAKVSVCSGGSGSPELELCLNDFMEYSNCSTYLRVGSCGGVADNVEVGDSIITTGVFREDGTSRAYIGDGFPAACHYELVSAMVAAAEKNDITYKLGVTACMDSDYVGNGRPSVGGYLQPDNINKLGTYSRAGVLNTDRESSILVTMCNLFGLRGGAVFNCTDNLLTGQKFIAGAGTEAAVTLALEGVAELYRMDLQKAAAGKTNWYPGIGE